MQACGLGLCIIAIKCVYLLDAIFNPSTLPDEDLVVSKIIILWSKGSEL